jgi:hypothetical protein
MDHSDSLIEPTPEEARNGWTAETLTAYVRRQQAARADAIDPARRVAPRPPVANSKYNPHRCWG